MRLTGLCPVHISAGQGAVVEAIGQVSEAEDGKGTAMVDGAPEGDDTTAEAPLETKQVRLAQLPGGRLVVNAAHGRAPTSMATLAKIEALVADLNERRRRHRYVAR